MLTFADNMGYNENDDLGRIVILTRKNIYDIVDFYSEKPSKKCLRQVREKYIDAGAESAGLCNGTGLGFW